MEEIQHYILSQEERIQLLNQEFFEKRSEIQKHYEAKIDNELQAIFKKKNRHNQTNMQPDEIKTQKQNLRRSMLFQFRNTEKYAKERTLMIEAKKQAK